MVKKIQKQGLVKSLKDVLSSNPFVVVIGYKGLTAQGIADLRRRLKDKKANLVVVKNTLSKIAIKDSGYDSLSEYFKDQVAISYSDDCVGLSNVLIQYAKDNETMQIKAGFLENKVVDINTIKTLSALGSLEDVRAAFLSKLVAPASNLMRLLEAPSSKLLTILKNYMSSKN
jgi:large subunit ribosomal protein L10